MAGDNLFSSFLDRVKGDTRRSIDAQGSTLSSPINSTMEGFYPTDDNKVLTNWYRQRPYAFVFTDRNGRSSEFYLPISPSNININTHFATNVITTMYGTVEEHSEQRYYDITIAGTTGMSPRYYDVVESQGLDLTKVVGRAGFPVKAKFSDAAGGFFKRTLSTLESATNQARDVLGTNDKPSTGINLRRTGYVAFHKFYKFFLAYKKDTASAGIRKTVTGGDSAHPLRFVNYKDNNQYDVSVQQFQLIRDSAEPMLYNYNIVLRAYNLRSADTQEVAKDIAVRTEELGLNGITNSVFNTMTNKIRSTKNAAFSAIAAAKGFGS